MNKTTVVHHSADFDGIFCREIARKFLPDAELIGWDFADKPLMAAHPGHNQRIYVLDLPVDKPFGLNASEPLPTWVFENVVWIDHHKSAIESHPTDIPGYRIDGVAACRLVWQWFNQPDRPKEGYSVKMFSKEAYVNRTVSEPYAVRLAGEYDIWDKRDPNADTFQFGLRSKELSALDWERLLDTTIPKALYGTGMEQTNSDLICGTLLRNGALLQTYQQRNDAGIMHKAFTVDWEGLKFLALNTARFNSLTFAAKDIPETGHDALMGFVWNGSKWTVSLYHANHRKDIDLSLIAVKHGGGGHRGACGFAAEKLPFLP